MSISTGVVKADWLQSNRRDVVLADVRWYLDGRSGRAAYDRKHIPGAVFLDLDSDLSGAPTLEGGRHPLPDPEAFASAMSRAGIGNGQAVVAYDDCGGMVAARLWWMLSVLGENAAVLDGGLALWDGPLIAAEEETDLPPQADFVPKPWPKEALATIEEVDKLSSGEETVILDARSPERFQGRPNAIDERFGHIPGAINAPFSANLSSDGTLLPAAALRQHYSACGVENDTPVIAYCGSGVSACLNLLALSLAGRPQSRLFVGSWSAWGADHTRPLETGA